MEKAAQNLRCLLCVIQEKSIRNFGNKIRCPLYPLEKSDIPGFARSDIFLAESDMKA